ncbi:hypothetical protein ACLKA7_010313 [Drosophila subpalustris]
MFTSALRSSELLVLGDDDDDDVAILSPLSVGIEHGILESYNSDFELQFSHPLKHIVGMCRIIHKPQAKTVGNGFMQLKSNAGSANLSAATTGSTSTSSTAAANIAAAAGNSLTANGARHTLTTSTSYGSLSSSAAAAYQLQQQQQQQQQAADAEQPQNFMEFQGPITGLVYLLKDPKDPLLHIYLFECETIEELQEIVQSAHIMQSEVL